MEKARTGSKLTLAPNQQWNSVCGKGSIEDICHFTFMLELIGLWANEGTFHSSHHPSLRGRSLHQENWSVFQKSLEWTSPIGPCVDTVLAKIGHQVHLCNQKGTTNATKLRFPLPKGPNAPTLTCSLVYWVNGVLISPSVWG